MNPFNCLFELQSLVDNPNEMRDMQSIENLSHSLATNYSNNYFRQQFDQTFNLTQKLLIAKTLNLPLILLGSNISTPEDYNTITEFIRSNPIMDESSSTNFLLTFILMTQNFLYNFLFCTFDLPSFSQHMQQSVDRINELQNQFDNLHANITDELDNMRQTTNALIERIENANEIFLNFDIINNQLERQQQTIEQLQRTANKFNQIEKPLSLYVRAMTLPAGTDLKNITTTGIYYAPENILNTLQRKPDEVHSAFLLNVFSTDGIANGVDRHIFDNAGQRFEQGYLWGWNRRSEI